MYTRNTSLFKHVALIALILIVAECIWCTDSCLSANAEESEITVTITEPGNNTEVKGGVVVQGIVSDVQNNDSAEVQIRVDEGKWEKPDQAVTLENRVFWAWGFESGNYSNGEHRLTVRFTGGTENQEIEWVTIMVNNTIMETGDTGEEFEIMGFNGYVVLGGIGFLILFVSILLVVVSRKMKRNESSEVFGSFSQTNQIGGNAQYTTTNTTVATTPPPGIPQSPMTIMPDMQNNQQNCQQMAPTQTAPAPLYTTPGSVSYVREADTRQWQRPSTSRPTGQSIPQQPQVPQPMTPDPQQSQSQAQQQTPMPPRMQTQQHLQRQKIHTQTRQQPTDQAQYQYADPVQIPPQNSVSTSQQPIPSMVWKCNRCGTAVGGSYMFCTNCGNPKSS